MSASREKRIRAELRGQEPQKKTAAQIGGAVRKRLGVMLIVVLALCLVALLLYGQGLPQRYITAVTVEGQNLSAVELGYYYLKNSWDFLNQYGELFVMYYGLDPYRPLAEQEYDEGMSWAEYLMNIAMNSVKDTVLFSNLAAEEGITLTEWDVERIDKAMEDIALYASVSSQSVNKYLSNIYGRGMNAEILRKCVERERLAARYEIHHRDSFTFSDADIQEHYEQNAQLFDMVDYRMLALSKTLGDEEYEAAIEAGDDPEAIVDTPIGEMTAENKMAYDSCALLAGEPGLTAETFNELAAGYAPEYFKDAYDEDPDYSLYEDSAYHESALMDWLFDAARVSGDIEVIENGDSFVTALFIGRTRHTGDTVTARRILAAPDADTDAAWNEADMRAGNLLRPMEGGIDENAFARKADDESDDYAAPGPGGLYKEISRGEFQSDEIDEWLFDAARKHGDVAMFRGYDGYSILFYAGPGRQEWMVNVETTLRDEAYNAFRGEKVLLSGNPERKAIGMRMVASL